MKISSPPRQLPSLKEWQAMMKPKPGQGDQVEVGKRKDEPLPQSLAEVRDRLEKLSFTQWDPYVATVAGSVAADQIELPPGETSLEVSLPEYYAEKVEVLIGTQNGPQAPMLVILPGIFGQGEGSHTTKFKQMALERGMNYLVLPNSLSKAMMEDKPLYHPGNTRLDSIVTHKMVSQLKQRLPEYFQQISVTGYSYGALHGLNLVRYDEEQSGPRLINGSLAVLSPPEELEHSMHQLDGLRQHYEGVAGDSVAATGLRYKHDVKKFGYEGFHQSELSTHGPGTNLAEIEMSDKYGSRDSLKELIETVDVHFGHNQLPKNTQEYADAPWWRKLQMRQEHDRIVDGITYDQFSREWVSKDRWLISQNLTPSQLSEEYSFSKGIEKISDTPVLVMASADDYILSAEDSQSMQALANRMGPLEAMRVFTHGGHMGVDWDPEIAQTFIDFAAAGANLRQTSAQ